ncbi:MAG: efflux RND transporter periplasmic adaptor subunit [Pseudomonadota bacterium]
MAIRRLSAACLALVLASCAEQTEQMPDPIIRPAKVLQVAADTEITSVRLPAIVGAADDSILTFQVSGLLQEWALTEGAEIDRGQVLARLDQRDYQTSVDSALASFNNAQSEFERAERLIAENAISQSIYEERRSQRDVARANLNSARKKLDDTIIRAPFSGVIADIHVESFENVAAQQPILTLQSSGDAEVIVQVPASLVVNIERLEPIDIFLELDAAPGTRMPATFVESASAADATTQTFEARFAFTPTDDLVILPGMTGLLDGRFRSLSDASEEAVSNIRVPVSAILAEAGDTYVWIVDMETLTVARRDVMIGPGVGENVIIMEGLSDGDSIIGAGGSYLYEGAEIRVYEN